MPRSSKNRSERSKAGRPPKFGPEMIKKAQEYLDSCEDYYDENTRRIVVDVPKAEGMALYLGVTRDTLYDWASKNSQFSYILSQMNQKQANRVINNSLSGAYNATIAKLLLGKHGYKESSEVDHTTKGEKVNQPSERAERIAEKYENELKDILKDNEQT